jgi:DNA-binding NarL/FixJ family response regulator
VLVADDVETLRTLIGRILERDGRYEVIGEARDGEEAVDLADKFKPDLVILDLMMPKKSGVEALLEIRDRSPSSAILVFSGSPTSELFGEIKPDGVLHKGASPTEILEMIERLLDRERA